MIKKNKKGFTLIELLAVIVILAVIMLIAGTRVFDVLDDARKDSFRTEFLSLLESIQTQASFDMISGGITSKRPTKCYKQSEITTFDVKGKEDYVYCACVELVQSSGDLKITGWLGSNQFKVVSKDRTLTREDVVRATDDEVVTFCENPTLGG